MHEKCERWDGILVKEQKNKCPDIHSQTQKLESDFVPLVTVGMS